MILSVLDRVVLLTILPKEGNFATLKILQELRMALSFTEDEVKKFNVRVNLEAGTTLWDESEDVEIPIGEKATDIVETEFKELESTQKLLLEMMGTYEKFITTTE